MIDVMFAAFVVISALFAGLVVCGSAQLIGWLIDDYMDGRS